MRLVVIESPYAGDVERNVAYAIACMRDCLARGEAPYASHLLFTQCLNDLMPQERELGIASGFEWGNKADATVVYMDLGESKGMTLGIREATYRGRPIEYRTLGGIWE